MANDLIAVPAEYGVDILRTQPRGLLQKALAFESLNVASAQTHDGEHYSHDRGTNTTIIAGNGMLLKKTGATMTVTMVLPGASVDDVLADTAQYTQQQQGALLGYSQSWVSRHEADVIEEANTTQRGRKP